MERENKTLEYKETLTKSFLKTVSAYANYGTGRIIFGVNDDGVIVGINDLDQLCLNIENSINDNITPHPSYRLTQDHDKHLIILTVEEGLDKPYYYKNKAYCRKDSSSIEVDRIELNRLILEGMNVNYEDLQAQNQDLTFHVLESYFQKQLGIKDFNKDTLITLGLYDYHKGYNKCAELFADKNDCKGIDIMRFGESEDVVLDRRTFEHASLLTLFEKTEEVFSLYYSQEIINGMTRERKYLIPQKAFREALANAIVHRSYDINAHINIAMHPEYITITSPGGLPSGLSEEAYENGNISVLRNPKIGNIFFRLRYIESFGTGIKRIKALYNDSLMKPEFIVTPSTISITLPILKEINLTEDELRIYNILSIHGEMSREEIEKELHVNKSKCIRLLNKLISQQLVEKVGQSSAIKYQLK